MGLENGFGTLRPDAPSPCIAAMIAPALDVVMVAMPFCMLVLLPLSALIAILPKVLEPCLALFAHALPLLNGMAQLSGARGYPLRICEQLAQSQL